MGEGPVSRLGEERARLDVAAQVETESKTEKRSIVSEFQEHTPGRGQHTFYRLNLLRCLGRPAWSRSPLSPPPDTPIISGCSEDDGAGALGVACGAASGWIVNEGLATSHTE